MKLFHRMILRALPGPFLGWLGTLMFLLLMQFLIKYLPDITGRGLPVSLSFLGVSFSEPRLLALGYAFEQLTRTHRLPVHTPPLPGETITY